MNSTEGQERVTLNVSEMTSQNHRSYDGRKFLLSYTSTCVNNSGSKSICDWNTNQVNDPSEYIANIGGGNSHENMPPYIAAYCWRRTNYTFILSKNKLMINFSMDSVFSHLCK